jgi:response regulator RpfG family c-di-GMP phosphodiesterase
MLVFLVDDDDVFNFMNEAIIQMVEPGTTVRIFKSGEDVVRHIEQDPDFVAPDLMFLDIRMPHMDGFALLEYLEQQVVDRFQHTCLHMLSSTLDEKDLLRANNNPRIQSLLSKPLSTDLVADLFRSLKSE